MSAEPSPKRPSKLRGDLAGMAEALAQFAQREFPQAGPAQPRVAVLVPCFNEEAAVGTVVADFRKAIPAAKIFVYDNNSKDRTIAIAGAAGAGGGNERAPGQGHGGAWAGGGRHSGA